MNQKIAVVFHSVCGNTYQMAQQYRRAFEELGAEVDFYRLPDPNYEVISGVFASSREYREEILAVPELTDPAAILDCRALFLGSPTYFGNVSGPVKVFMDSFVDYWAEARLAGKYFGAFTTSGTPQGGADLCLGALNTFAMHMGMAVISVPSIITGSVQPAYGLACYSGDLSDRRPTPGDSEAIRSFARYAAAMIGK